MGVKTPREYKQMEFAGVMIELAKLFKPQLYVELGVRKGETFLKMAPHVRRAVGVDLQPIGFVLPGNCSFNQMSTLQFAQGQKDESIDFLFIDADHKWTSVLADLSAFLPKVKTGTGLIFMHDTHPIIADLAVEGYCHDAWRAANYVFNQVPGKQLWGAFENLEIVTLPGPWAGLSILRKRGEHHLSWATADFGTPVIKEEANNDTTTTIASGSECPVLGSLLLKETQSDMASGDVLPADDSAIPTKNSNRRRVRNR